MNSPIAIEVKNLIKRFGETVVVNDVSLSVSQGEIYALIGENGAGKTTMIKIMTNLYVPDAGTVRLFGHNICTESESAKKLFGYISDNPIVYGHLTGREFYFLAGRLRGMSIVEIEKRITELMPVFTLEELIDSPMSDLSRGNRQKIAFIACLLAKPKLIIIDEPIVGLDPDSIEIFGNTLQRFVKDGGTVFFSTHILSFAEQFATRAGIIHHGIFKGEIRIEKTTNLNDLYHTK